MLTEIGADGLRFDLSAIDPDGDNLDFIISSPLTFIGQDLGQDFLFIADIRNFETSVGASAKLVLAPIQNGGGPPPPPPLAFTDDDFISDRTR